jgi:hypothetical protein
MKGATFEGAKNGINRAFEALQLLEWKSMKVGTLPLLSPRITQPPRPITGPYSPIRKVIENKPSSKPGKHRGSILLAIDTCMANPGERRKDERT